MGLAKNILAVGIILAGCSRSETEPAQSATPTEQGKATFVNRVWKVSESTGVQPEQLYVFLSEGTLVVASTTGTPSVGKWSYEGNTLTMVEEGITYKVDILRLSSTEFRIRSNNPGGNVDITLVPAE